MSLWTQYHDGDDVCELSDQVTGNPIKDIGLPVMSFKAVNALLNGQSHRGGYVATWTDAVFVELRGYGLLGPKFGLTRRGAAFAHLLQCLYFEGNDECGQCRAAYRVVGQR